MHYTIHDHHFYLDPSSMSIDQLKQPPHWWACTLAYIRPPPTTTMVAGNSVAKIQIDRLYVKCIPE